MQTFSARLQQYFERKIHVAPGFTASVRAQLQRDDHVLIDPEHRSHLAHIASTLDAYDAHRASAVELFANLTRPLSHVFRVDQARSVCAAGSRLRVLPVTARDTAHFDWFDEVANAHSLLGEPGALMLYEYAFAPRCERMRLQHMLLDQLPIYLRHQCGFDYRSPLVRRAAWSLADVHCIHSANDYVNIPAAFCVPGEETAVVRSGSTTLPMIKPEYEARLLWQIDLLLLLAANVYHRGDQAMGIMLTTYDPTDPIYGSTSDRLLPLGTMYHLVPWGIRPVEISFLNRPRLLFHGGLGNAHAELVSCHDVFHTLSLCPDTPSESQVRAHLDTICQQAAKELVENSWPEFFRAMLLDVPQRPSGPEIPALSLDQFIEAIFRDVTFFQRDHLANHVVRRLDVDRAFQARVRFLHYIDDALKTRCATESYFPALQKGMQTLHNSTFWLEQLHEKRELLDTGFML